jgi:pyridoxal phosphate enzyme (YggS family)
VIDVPALRARLADVRARIARAADRAKRDPASIRLVAVSKTFSADHVRAAVEAGAVDFGENKVQEALAKMDQTSDLPLRWHLVGHLQSNKAKKAGARFDVVHSIDDPELIATVDAAAIGAGRRLELFVQVDLAGEATKHGAREEDLLPIFEAAGSSRAARVTGLMILPPDVDDPEEVRPFFRALREVRERLRARGVDAGLLNELSMGMSHDFEVAIEEGATLIRLGTAIFGTRPLPRSQSD